MRAVRVAAGLGLAALLAGCVLITPPLEVGDHCGIQGDTECAKCLRESCQAPIDACCGSSSCASASVLGDVDACGRGENPRCIDALATARTTKTEEDVRACASKSCRAICTKGATGSGGTQPKWTCTTAREPANACATCVYEKCGASLDTCCGDSSCKNDSSIQTDVGACIAGDTSGCAYSQEKSRGTSGQAGVVRACLLKECGTACMGDGRTHVNCTLLSGGSYCTCSASEKPGSTPCDAATVGGYCVLGDHGCTCGAYACSDSSLGCSCGFNGDGSSTSCSAPAGSSSSSPGRCCLKVSDTAVSCACGKYQPECDNDRREYSIASCDFADVKPVLDRGGFVVTECSR